MHHEAAHPETSHTPEKRLFEVDAMTDAQITVTYRGTKAIADAGEQPGDSFDQMSVGDSLSDDMVAGINGLAIRDPERVKTLLHGLAMSQNEADQELAAYTARSLVHHDPAITTGILVSLMYDHDRLIGKWDHAAEVARDQTRLMMRDDMTPDQVTALRAHLSALDQWDLGNIRPALPDER